VLPYGSLFFILLKDDAIVEFPLVGIIHASGALPGMMQEIVPTYLFLSIVSLCFYEFTTNSVL
jgi:hypothetical protein